MAEKSTIPLVLLAGGAALLLTGKKKKKKKKKTESAPDGGLKIKFNSDCTDLVGKISPSAHDAWLTNRYSQLVAEGIEDLNQLTIQLLKEQDSHCPWDDPSKWTPFMKDIYDQLRAGVGAWHEQTATGPNEITFMPDLSQYKIGSGYRVNVLDPWLDQRRKDGKLATVDHDAGKLYAFFIDDPTTWLGDITGTGKVGGSVIYGALWLMATAGIGIYASGFASTGASLQAATQAASTTQAMKILGPRATLIAGELYKKGLSSSRIALTLMNFGGEESLAKYGVSAAISKLSAGAAGFGMTMTAGVLAELGIDEAFAPDLAASATEAVADFSLHHDVLIAGEQVPIALLPSSYPAVQEFNKWLMAYIIRFQKLRFEN